MEELHSVVKPPPLTGNRKKDKRLLAKALLQASKTVAKKLNNTASVARSSYIHPAVFREWAIEKAGADPGLFEEVK
jgi:DNA topoisomerase IB